MGLTIYEALTFLPNVFLIIVQALFYALKGPFRESNQAKNYADYVIVKGTNAFLNRLSVSQLQYVNHHHTAQLSGLGLLWIADDLL